MELSLAHQSGLTATLFNTFISQVDFRQVAPSYKGSSSYVSIVKFVLPQNINYPWVYK